MTFVELSSRSGSWGTIFPDHSRHKAIKLRQAVSPPWLLGTHTPTNEDEHVSVLIPQAPGEEKTFSFLKATLLKTTAPLGYPLAESLAQAPAPVAAVLVVPVTPIAHPLVHSASVAVVVLVSTPEMAHPLAPFLPLLENINKKIPQILPRPDPVPQKVAQIATHIAISIVPSLR
jgi:hypothetical protein